MIVPVLILLAQFAKPLFLVLPTLVKIPEYALIHKIFSVFHVTAPDSISQGLFVKFQFHAPVIHVKTMELALIQEIFSVIHVNVPINILETIVKFQFLVNSNRAV